MSMYFKDSEFACHCCGELPPNGMNSVLLEKLDTLREMACEQVYVTCGYRCPKFQTVSIHLVQLAIFIAIILVLMNWQSWQKLLGSMELVAITNKNLFMLM